MGTKNNFQKPTWIIVTLIGVACLIDNNFDNADRVVWPVAIMGFGAWLAFRPRKQTEEYLFDKPKQTFHFDNTTEPEA